MNIRTRLLLYPVILSVLFITVGFVSAQTLPADMSSADTTAPTVAVGPSISSVGVTNITATSAEIDVVSDEMVQGYVEYGPSDQYGMSTPLTAEFSTSPTFILENLSPETTYHYRVIVMDSAGNVAITGDETFTTLKLSAPEPESTPTAPAATSTEGNTATSTPLLVISNTEAASIGTSTARITWLTNKDADARVEYGTASALGTFSPVGVSGLSHSISLVSLSPDTKYYYRAMSKTASGEIANSPEYVFTTLVAQATPSYPFISNVVIGPVDASTAIISWTTSKPTTSDIQYGTTTSYDFSLGKSSGLGSSHSRTIVNLSSGTLYHVRIIVTDSDGNTVYGKDRTFTTTASSGATISTTTAPTNNTVDGSNKNSDTLAQIAQRGQQAAPRGGGGLPVAPSRPLLLNVIPLDGQVVFDWHNDKGTKNGTIHTLIIRKQGTDSVRSRIDGDIVYNGPSTTFTDTNVENDKEYHYALYSYGAYGRFTEAARFKVLPRAGKEEIDIPAATMKDKTAPTILFSRDLFRGSRGDDVARLQKYLSAHGYYPEALITGYFGAFTQQAVMRFQKLNGISPIAGYAGSVTREMLMGQR